MKGSQTLENVCGDKRVPQPKRIPHEHGSPALLPTSNQTMHRAGSYSTRSWDQGSTTGTPVWLHVQQAQEKARLESWGQEGQWGGKQPNGVEVTQRGMCRGTDAKAANCKDNSVDSTANHILPVLLRPQLAPRFSGLSASNSVHSTKIIEWQL